ncbi:ABC transporter substrate-binding protein [Leptotrichia hofstadii]|uniref:Periplasmic binding protein n=1 Tax=Leptotrichia hofstadii F0254 TaxID=634994 RepID=C9MY73_9FUSO|nr:helical backbone metal receptor [Leptotrichia hofstadii]EEX74453.1 periplasmic binding protein [Leptotrichia hofstadii F0254]
MKKIMKNSFYLALLIISMFIISCAKKNAENGKKDENKEYNRIVVLDPATVEMIYMLGAEDKIVGVANLERSKVWPEEKVAKLESVGTFIKPSLERIITLKPDLVITSALTDDNLNNGLKSNNIEAKRIQANSIEEIFTNFMEVAKMLGKENEANKIIAEKRAKLEEIKKMATINKKGLFVMSASPLMVFGNDNLPNDIMKLLNIKNIAENQKGRNPIVTPEFIIKENPDMIITLLPNPSQIVATNPQLKNVNAIKNSKFIVVNSSQILRGSPRTIDQIEEIAKAVTK